MKDLWNEGTIHQKTRCWSQGMDGWRPVEQIAQLKWYLMATGIPLMNESEMAALILDTLVRICSFYPSRYVHGLSPMLFVSRSNHIPIYGTCLVMLLFQYQLHIFHSDSDNAVIRPLPRAKRLLSEPNTLPHLVQLLLTFDPRLVEKVVTLLNIIMEVGTIQNWFILTGLGDLEDARRRRLCIQEGTQSPIVMVAPYHMLNSNLGTNACILEAV